MLVFSILVKENTNIGVCANTIDGKNCQIGLLEGVQSFTRWWHCWTLSHIQVLSLSLVVFESACFLSLMVLHLTSLVRLFDICSCTFAGSWRGVTRGGVGGLLYPNIYILQCISFQGLWVCRINAHFFLQKKTNIAPYVCDKDKELYIRFCRGTPAKPYAKCYICLCHTHTVLYLSFSVKKKKRKK